VPHRFAASGSPILEGSAAFMDCRLHTVHEAGDHLIVIGEVLELEVKDGNEPLLFHGGGYRLLQPSGA
jgi:3-hydroxy-9,10-secoandrosta-1,3,5(10)-triene-9,17-dione monooxygenase reductase component